MWNKYYPHEKGLILLFPNQYYNFYDYTAVSRGHNGMKTNHLLW